MSSARFGRYRWILPRKHWSSYHEYKCECTLNKPGLVAIDVRLKCHIRTVRSLNQNGHQTHKQRERERERERERGGGGGGKKKKQKRCESSHLVFLLIGTRVMELFV